MSSDAGTGGSPASQGGNGGSGGNEATGGASATGGSAGKAGNGGGAGTGGAGGSDGSTPQGLYDSCSPGDADCLGRLDTMAAAGFKLVLNYSQEQGTAADQLTYLDHANSVGMKVIFSFSDPVWYDNTDLRNEYKALATTCNCTDNAGFIKYLVGLVKNHPALWGYYVADEPSAAQHTAVKAFSDQVHTADPNHPRWIVGNADVSLIEPFADDVEVIGLDIYPFQTAPTSQECIDSVGALAKDGQALATKHGRKWAMVLQAMSWSEYPNDFTPCCGARWPTRAEFRGQREQALQFAKPEFILWFSYFDLLRSDDYTGHWNDLVAGAFGP